MIPTAVTRSAPRAPRAHLREVRKSLGFTQERLANLVGVHREAYVQIEGGCGLSLSLALRIAAVLKRPVEDLFSDVIASWEPPTTATGT